MALLIIVVVAAVLAITTRLVLAQSRTRAAAELEAAAFAFHAQMALRASAAQLSSRLVTELPVFRAHLTDRRLATDRASIDAMADGYRTDLEAAFAIVTDAQGMWLASPGWMGPSSLAPIEVEHAIDDARVGRPATALIPTPTALVLLVSTPAMFADEVLGTLSVGYALTDEVVRELARVLQSDVTLVWGRQVVATSLVDTARGDWYGAGHRGQ